MVFRPAIPVSVFVSPAIWQQRDFFFLESGVRSERQLSGRNKQMRTAYSPQVLRPPQQCLRIPSLFPDGTSNRNFTATLNCSTVDKHIRKWENEWLTISFSSSNTRGSSVFSHSLSDLSWEPVTTKFALGLTARHQISAWWPFNTKMAKIAQSVAKEIHKTSRLHSLKVRGWRTNWCTQDRSVIPKSILNLPRYDVPLGGGG